MAGFEWPPRVVRSTTSAGLDRDAASEGVSDLALGNMAEPEFIFLQCWGLFVLIDIGVF